MFFFTHKTNLLEKNPFCHLKFYTNICSANLILFFCNTFSPPRIVYNITNEEVLRFLKFREVKIVCQKIEDAVAVVSVLEMTVAGL